jgi:ribosomal-protein-alanine N-acetyltransferase
MGRGNTPQHSGSYGAGVAESELVEKLGFRCEGRLRDNLRVGDEWRDDMLYAQLATERSGQT